MRPTHARWIAQGEGEAFFLAQGDRVFEPFPVPGGGTSTARHVAHAAAGDYYHSMTWAHASHDAPRPRPRPGPRQRMLSGMAASLCALGFLALTVLCCYFVLTCYRVL